mmetsp:Transcript_10520/g.16102  ORF Transcript_10520/g.16102 Transcript_10520/m.16102 type:complete len:117 (-) Transcript_10520:35-385(-)
MMLAQQSSNSVMVTVCARDFSLKTRRLKAKKLAKRSVKKYKLKTRKAMQKRIRVVGGFGQKEFKYCAVGRRHYLRNKKKRTRTFHRNHRHIVGPLGNHKICKRLMPYFKRRKFLKS